jgi:hypothetical protein
MWWRHRNTMSTMVDIIPSGRRNILAWTQDPDPNKGARVQRSSALVDAGGKIPPSVKTESGVKELYPPGRSQHGLVDVDEGNPRFRRGL